MSNKDILYAFQVLNTQELKEMEKPIDDVIDCYENFKDKLAQAVIMCDKYGRSVESIVNQDSCDATITSKEIMRLAFTSSSLKRIIEAAGLYTTMIGTHLNTIEEFLKTVRDRTGIHVRPPDKEIKEDVQD